MWTFFAFKHILSPGTGKVAALSMPSDGFHNLYSAACVLGHFASCSEHLQPHYNRESDPQTSPGGKTKQKIMDLFSFEK